MLQFRVNRQKRVQMPRVSKFSTIKKDIKVFPFHLLLEAYLLGVRREESYLEKQYNELVQRREQAWTDSHEAPYEGNFYDELGGVPKLDLATRDKIGFEEVALAIERLGIQANASWILPQLQAYIADTMTLVKDKTGKYDALASIKGWIQTDDEAVNNYRKGMAILAKFPRRGAFVKAQFSEEMKNYSAVVPLMLAPFKKYRGIGYESWSLKGLNSMVDDKLYEAMVCEVPEGLTKDELLGIRELGLQVASNPGESRNPTKTHRLYGIKDTKLGRLPDLAVTMLTQIWVCSPHIRTEYMVCDPTHWDAMPEPLLTIEVFEERETITKSRRETDSEELDRILFG